jgi:hypothetical protein
MLTLPLRHAQGAMANGAERVSTKAQELDSIEVPRRR